MITIHKTMTLKQRKKLGYEGYLERSLCNRQIYSIWCMPSNNLKRLWKKVNCKYCLRRNKK